MVKREFKRNGISIWDIHGTIDIWIEVGMDTKVYMGRRDGEILPMHPQKAYEVGKHLMAFAEAKGYEPT